MKPGWAECEEGVKSAGAKPRRLPGNRSLPVSRRTADLRCQRFAACVWKAHRHSGADPGLAVDPDRPAKPVGETTHDRQADAMATLFVDAEIYASNDLDEHVIRSLKGQGATIAVWGVGTRLVTGHGQAALGGLIGEEELQTTAWPGRCGNTFHRRRRGRPGSAVSGRSAATCSSVGRSTTGCARSPRPTTASAVVYGDPQAGSKTSQLTAPVLNQAGRNHDHREFNI